MQASVRNAFIVHVLHGERHLLGPLEMHKSACLTIQAYRRHLLPVILLLQASDGTVGILIRIPLLDKVVERDVVDERHGLVRGYRSVRVPVDGPREYGDDERVAEMCKRRRAVGLPTRDATLKTLALSPTVRTLVPDKIGPQSILTACAGPDRISNRTYCTVRCSTVTYSETRLQRTSCSTNHSSLASLPQMTALFASELSDFHRYC